MASLEWQDYLVFGAFLLISLVIGIYFALTGGKQKSAGEFISGIVAISYIPRLNILLKSNSLINCIFYKAAGGSFHTTENTRTMSYYNISTQLLYILIQE